MRSRAAIWAGMLAIAIVVLVWPRGRTTVAGKVKTRPSRITAVNTVHSVSFAMTNTGAPSVARPGSSR